MRQARVADSDGYSLERKLKDSFQRIVGLAYNVGGKGTTIVRAGYGIYYDLLFGNITGNLAQFNGLTVKTLTLTGAAAAARFRGQNFGFPPGALPNVPPPPGLGLPFTHKFAGANISLC